MTMSSANFAHNPVDYLCEWWPAQNRPALGLTPDEHQGCPNVATLLVGTGADNWRLCDSCAVLPRFARKRRRSPIKARVQP